MRLRRNSLGVGLLAISFWTLLALSASAGVSASGRVTGLVLDSSGGVVPVARVVLITPGGSQIRGALTDAAGRYSFDQLEPGRYILAVEKAGFRQHRRTVVVGTGDATEDVTLSIQPVTEDVTVTAVRGMAQDIKSTPQFITVTDSSELVRRNASLFPGALAEEPSVHVQQTSTSQGSPFIRGLTGQQVVTLIDGVRFNNATFRPGANQYTALVDPAFAGQVEIVRGPNGSQYGSDSLGGTINVLTNPIWSGRDHFGLDGGVTLGGSSADLAASTNAYLAGGSRNWGFAIEGSARRADDLRTGGGIDSHSVATRLLGLSSTVLGDRLEDTGFSQFGVRAKVAIHPRPNDVVTAQYIRGQQNGASRYDQLNGGTGNLINRFDPQALDFLAVRYDRLGLPLFDALSATVSFNGQRDDRTSQSVNNTRLGLLSPISEEHNRTNVFGYQFQASRLVHGSHAIALGGEMYDELVYSTKTDLGYNAMAGGFADATQARGRFPNGARYRSSGLFAQDVFPLFWRRLSASLAVRYSRFRYSQSAEDNPVTASGPTVPTYATTFGDMTFNTGLVLALTDKVALTASVSRGFRAPNVNDFGSIGLSGLGFEVSPDEGLRMGASVAPFISGQVPAPGQIWPVHQLEPERLLNYEVGAKLNWSRVSATAAWFDSEIDNLIERRVIVLPAGAVGQAIGGQQILRQGSLGEVYTALSSSPVFVRTNAGRVRLRGADIAGTLRIGTGVTLNGNVSSVRGTDLNTGLPPGLENGIPPTHGFVGLRWEHRGARGWLEVYSLFAAAQRRLSGNDLEQARIGGIRTQQEITNFFNNGAVALGLVRNGILVATGETLSQVLTRVLGPDITARVPFMTENPGYFTLNVRGGVRLSRSFAVTVLFENVLDRNYRTMGSGIDGPGRSLVVRNTFGF